VSRIVSSLQAYYKHGCTFQLVRLTSLANMQHHTLGRLGEDRASIICTFMDIGVETDIFLVEG